MAYRARYPAGVPAVALWIGFVFVEEMEIGMRKLFSALIVLVAFGATGAWAAGDAAAGAAKAAVCAACHGLQGVSLNPMWPNLAGQQHIYLAKQIKAFRDGARTEVTMQPFVASLSDQDAEDLAAHYAALTACP